MGGNPLSRTETLTVSEAVERTGLPRAVVLERLARGAVPGAVRMTGRAWSIPAASLPHLDPATDTAPPLGGGDGAGRLATEDNLETPGQSTAQPSLRELVDVARRVEVATSTSSTRSARAAADGVWTLVELASRHVVSRDGLCVHCGWQWPCPDRVDVVDGLETVTRWILEGEGHA